MLNAAKGLTYMEDPQLLDDPQNLLHGLMDPSRIKNPKQFSLADEAIRVDKGVFNCMHLAMTGTALPRRTTFLVRDLLRDCTWITAETREVYKASPHQAHFFPSLRTDGAETEIWPVVQVSRDRVNTICGSFTAFKAAAPKFFSTFVRVRPPSPTPAEYFFEGRPRRIATRHDRKAAVRSIQQDLRKLGLYRQIRNPDVQHVGQYMLPLPVTGRTLPEPCLIYAVTFYLGSLVRYQPHALDAMLGGADAWIIEAFLRQCPIAFAYLMMNHFWRREHIFHFAA
jgi:hypothetical protein